MNSRMKRNLINRLNFRVPSGETIHFVHGEIASKSDMQFAITIIIMMVLAMVMLGTLPLVEMYSPSVYFAIVVWTIIVGTLIIILVLVLIRTRLQDIISFNVVVLTDKAIYTSMNLRKKRDFISNLFVRISYEDMIGLDYDPHFHPRSYHLHEFGLRLRLKTSTDEHERQVIPFKGCLKFKDKQDMERVKNVIESLIFTYQPLAKQMELQRKKPYAHLRMPGIFNGNTSGNARFGISAPAFAKMQKKKKRLVSCAIVLGAVAAGIIAMLILTSFSVAAIVFGYFIGGACFCPSIFVVLEYNRLKSYKTNQDTQIWFDSNSMHIDSTSKQEAIGFTPELLFKIAASVKDAFYIADWESDTLVFSQISNAKTKVSVGPVDDLFGMYFTFLEHYLAWMRANDHFLKPEEIANRFLASDPFLNEIAAKLAESQPSGKEFPASPTTVREHIGNLHSRIDWGTTKYPMDFYQLYLEPGEEIMHVYTPGFLKEQVLTPGFLLLIASFIAIVTIAAWPGLLSGFVRYMLSLLIPAIFVLPAFFLCLYKVSLIRSARKMEIAFTTEKMIFAQNEGKAIIVPRENISSVIYWSMNKRLGVYKQIVVYLFAPLKLTPLTSNISLHYVEIDSPVRAILDDYSKTKLL